MAQLTLDIPDQHVNRVLDGVCGALGYTTGSKAQFVKSALIEYLKTLVKRYEIDQQIASSSTTIGDEIDAVDVQ